MENNFSLNSIRLDHPKLETKAKSLKYFISYDNDANIKKNSEVIILSDDETIEKSNSSNNSCEDLSIINCIFILKIVENIIKNNKQLVDFCLTHSLTKINILNFLIIFNFKRDPVFKYLYPNDEFICEIRAGKRICGSKKWKTKCDAK